MKFSSLGSCFKFWLDIHRDQQIQAKTCWIYADSFDGSAPRSLTKHHIVLELNNWNGWAEEKEFRLG